MPKQEITPFNKEKEFKEKCSKLINELRGICYEIKVPFFFTACTKNDESGSTYARECIMPAVMNEVLSDDQLSRHFCVGAGFDVIAKGKEMEVVMEDITVDYSTENT